MIVNSFICPICKNNLKKESKIFMCNNCCISYHFDEVNKYYNFKVPTNIIKKIDQYKWYDRNKFYEIMAYIYRKQAKTKNLNYEKPSYDYSNKLNNEIDQLKGTYYLDIGGGDIRKSNKAQIKWYTVNIDKINLSGIKENLVNIYGVGEFLPFPDNLFDNVLNFSCINHCINPKIFMDEIYRVLKPNGCLLMTFEDYYDNTNKEKIQIISNNIMDRKKLFFTKIKNKIKRLEFRNIITPIIFRIIKKYYQIKLKTKFNPSHLYFKKEDIDKLLINFDIEFMKLFDTFLLVKARKK